MTLSTTVKAHGAGWRVAEVQCTAGPRDPVQEEQHADICVAVVLSGSFRYRSPEGTATLVPGAMLLGNAGACFACGHEHSAGDRCLAFHFDPACFEEILAATPGAKRLAFAHPALPPLSGTARLIASAEAAAEEESLEEVAVELAGAAVTAAADAPQRSAPDLRHAGRIAEIARWIEADLTRPLPLPVLAREAGLSRFHFLRSFRDLLGITPYQFVLHQRLRKAALRLRQSDDAVMTIALDSGFADLSEFNRRFRRLFGMTPTAFRRLRSTRPGPP